MNAETSRAVSAEFLGTLVFCFLANTSQSAMGVGLAYAVSSAFYSYMSAHASRTLANVYAVIAILKLAPARGFVPRAVCAIGIVP